jgi:agmatinase
MSTLYSPDRRAFFRSVLGFPVAAGAVGLAPASAQQPAPGSTQQPESPKPPDPNAQPMRHPRARTFYGADPVDFEKLNHQIAIVGVPFDLGTTARPGTRFGPRALREVAGGGAAPAPTGDKNEKKWPGYYDYEEGERYLVDVSRADVGDVNIMAADFMPNFDRITDAIKKILAKGALPVVLGGDHSITFPVMRAYEGIKGKVYIIHFDSHLDFSDGGGFVRFAHGNPLRRSIELSWVGGLTSIGIRGLAANTRTYEEGQKMGVQVIPALRALRMGIKEAIESIPKADNYYITFDVDSIDPSLLTGTGTPVPGGFTYYQAKEALQEIAKKGGKIVGYEFVEVAPPYEVFETSSRMAARLIMDFMAAIFKHQGHLHPQPPAPTSQP